MRLVRTSTAGTLPPPLEFGSVTVAMTRSVVPLTTLTLSPIRFTMETRFVRTLTPTTSGPPSVGAGIAGSRVLVATPMTSVRSRLGFVIRNPSSHTPTSYWSGGDQPIYRCAYDVPYQAIGQPSVSPSVDDPTIVNAIRQSTSLQHPILFPANICVMRMNHAALRAMPKFFPRKARAPDRADSRGA